MPLDASAHQALGSLTPPDAARGLRDPAFKDMDMIWKFFCSMDSMDSTEMLLIHSPILHIFKSATVSSSLELCKG